MSTWARRIRRAWAAARPWLWLLILGWVIAIYFITHYLLPRLPLSASGSVYVVQPTLWFSLGLVGFLFWRQGLREKPPLFTYIGVVALLAGVFHIALLILVGVMVGFGHSPYGHSPAIVAQNLLYVGSGVLGLELARACLVAVFSRRSSLLALASVSLGLALITIPPARFTDLSGGETGFHTTGDTFLPALAESLLASFLALVGGPLAAIAYRGALEGFRWISPILPDLSWSATAFVGTLAPAMALLIIRGLTVSAPAGAAHTEDRRGSWSLVPLGVALVAVGLIWLSSGLLGVRPALVAGQSMEPTLRAGDVVLTREVSSDDIAVGDIVRFSNGGTTILHRVVEIYDSGSTRWIVTKGDANNTNDSPITADQVEGKVVATIPKIGQVGIFVKNTLGRLLGSTLGTIVVGDTVWGASGSPAPFTAILTASGQVHTGSWQEGAATVEIHPQTLNLKSQGQWVTAYVELPQGYNVGNVDTSTSRLCLGEVAACPEDASVPAAEHPTAVGDHDGDTIPDRMLKFDRQALIDLLGGQRGDVAMTVSGLVTPPPGQPFAGSDTIRVIDRGCGTGGGVCEDEETDEASPAPGTAALPESTPLPETTPAPEPDIPTFEYQVQPGDTPPPDVPTIEYTVRPGERLWDVAAFFGTTVDILVALNGLTDPNLVVPGQRLLVPAPPAEAGAIAPVFTTEHVVQPGETLTDIAARFGTTVEALAAANNLANPSAIRIGDRLLVP